jgi:hypothetical protein
VSKEHFTFESSSQGGGKRKQVLANIRIGAEEKGETVLEVDDELL